MATIGSGEGGLATIGSGEGGLATIGSGEGGLATIGSGEEGWLQLVQGKEDSTVARAVPTKVSSSSSVSVWCLYSCHFYNL